MLLEGLASAGDPLSPRSAIRQRKPLEVAGSPKDSAASSVEDYGWGMVPASWLYRCEVSAATSATNRRPLLQAAGSTKSQAGSVKRVRGRDCMAAQLPPSLLHLREVWHGVAHPRSIL
ncbi:unnamed protein product [Pleuronectes platessa]|uniref:Uncharacterized protein n=1 Tax=Pleuronectes platessa TaxID=8262 RepID=A0A9N7TUJ4_PLEPL|nr:unnamed protein product [Pleuronectes platessa]